ncbi:PepSY-like domain-containing protein [uncultured Campylobacter sp.]|uniref:PepSY-like domain-containing protein n=1 Tax=uncultured Campylobacter sp. TaxID=218934 RepID=UPI0026288A3C|nr:PepSY-like domain-containing protein [uncultured Campylobacter sp.]
MKKLRVVALATLFCASSLFADMAVAPNTLPAKIHNFVKQHFKGANIMFAERDMTSFDIDLSDGTKIEFNINGDWTDIDGRYKAIPTTFLPNAVVSKVKAAQPNAQIMEVDRTINGYKFKFNNMMEVYTDANGNVVGQKFDD